jgi:uncharacterized protein YxjI
VLRDPAGQEVAEVRRHMFTQHARQLRDSYAVDVAPGQDDLVILAAVLALDLANDRERRDD